MEAQRPLVGHNMHFDLAFLFEQFVAPLPASFTEFALEWRKLFGAVYDTKALAGSTGDFNKTQLSHLFYRCQKDKRISNNLLFAFDEAADPKFGAYKQSGGQAHDAGFDAYMTGHGCAALAKRIEIG